MPNPDDNAAKNKSRKRLILFLAPTVVILATLFILSSFVGGRDRAEPVMMGDIVATKAASGFNLLLITFDTTRPDHLGCYGDKPARTPHIDQLGEHGVRFDDAAVSVPMTLPSHATILTGLNPYHHGVRTNDGYQLAEEFVTLPEILKKNGYQTAAFVSCFVLDRRFGLAQGFDTYNFETTIEGRTGPESVFNERPADKVTNAAIDWFDRYKSSGTSSPFFVWVHYYDPHNPYRSPLMSEPAFKDRPYDAEISFADREMGRLLKRLDETGLGQRTLTVFTTDHGESLEEHGETSHGLFIYESTIHAALIFSSPAVFSKAFRVSDRVAGSIDIVPTVIDLLGLKTDVKVDGISLLRKDAPADRSLYLESLYPTQGKGCAPIHGLRTHVAKYILAPKPEYYDLNNDPHELQNLYNQNPPGVSDLEKRLSTLMASWPTEASGSSLRAMSSDEIEKLRSLGYISGSHTVENSKLPDAKDMLPIFKQTAKVNALVNDGKIAEALRLAQEIASECEGYESPIHAIAEIYEHLGRRDEAARLMEDYIKKYPSANMFVHAAKNYLAMKEWDNFERSLKAAEALEPLRGSIPLLRGDRFAAQGRHEEALRQYERAFEIDGNRMGPEQRQKLERARRRVQSSQPTGG